MIASSRNALQSPYRPEPVAPDPALGTGDPLGCVLGAVRFPAPAPAPVLLGCVDGVADEVTSDPRVPPLASLEPPAVPPAVPLAVAPAPVALIVPVPEIESLAVRALSSVVTFADPVLLLLV